MLYVVVLFGVNNGPAVGAGNKHAVVIGNLPVTATHDRQVTLMTHITEAQALVTVSHSTAVALH